MRGGHGGRAVNEPARTHPEVQTGGSPQSAILSST